MANNFAPFGFRPVNTSNGPVNWRISARRISASNVTPIYKGDAVMQATGPATGYIKQATNALTATTPLAGVFWGCQYLSQSQNRVVWNQYWPGNDAVNDVIAYVIDDPNARFVVQTSGGGFQVANPYAFGSSPVGQNVNLSIGTGTPLTGQSGMFISQIGTAAAYPFVCTGMVLDPPGSNGTDATAVYNWIEVGFNNEWLRSNTAVTGIS